MCKWIDPPLFAKLQTQGKFTGKNNEMEKALRWHAAALCWRRKKREEKKEKRRCLIRREIQHRLDALPSPSPAPAAAAADR